MKTPLIAACLSACLLAGCAQWPAQPPRAVPQAAATERGLKVAQLAEAEQGVPYLYGGSSPRGFDCSGLAWYVYRQVGVSLPRTAQAQYDHLPRVARGELKPGDLVFFFGGVQMHVGIYLGDGRFVHAPETGAPVSNARLDTGYWNDHYVAGARP